MPHPAHDGFPTLTDADLVTATGGFMDMVNQFMGMAGNMVNQFGDDKAKAAFGQASQMVGQFGGMAQGLMGAFGGK